MTEKFDYVFFDLDGTLTNSSEGIIRSLEYAFDKMGLDVPPRETLYKFIGPPLTVSFSELMGFDEKLTEKAIKLYRERYTVTGLYENYPYDGMELLLKETENAEKKLAVATSKPEFMSVKVLEHFGLSKYFETISGSADESQTKTDVINEACRRLHVSDSDRDKVIMVGDRMHDIIGAHACNIRCCGVEYGFAPKGEFSEYGADFVTGTVEDLKKFLLSH